MLAELHGDRTERRERWRLTEHSFRQVRMHPHPLPFTGTEGPAFVPDRVGDAQSSEALDEPRPPKSEDTVSRHPRSLGGARRQVRHPTGMAEEVGRLQADEV